MPDQISFDDCCKMILDDWRWRQDEIAPPLRDYKRRLLALLNQELGIDWYDDCSEIARQGGLPALVATMPRDYANLVSPFACWVEYSLVSGEGEVLSRYRERLASAEKELKQRWVDLFRDLLLLRWPAATHRTTSWTRLMDLGLGDPVDELDFL